MLATVIKLAYDNPSLRKHLLPLIKEASSVPLNAGTTPDEFIQEFLNQAAQLAFGRQGVMGVSGEAKGIYIIEITQPEWNKNEPGEVHTHDITIVVDFYRRRMSVRINGERGQALPFEILQATMLQTSKLMKRLVGKMPSAFKAPDSPSLDDRIL